MHAIDLDQMSILLVPQLIERLSPIDEFAHQNVSIDVRLFGFLTILVCLYEDRNVCVLLLNCLRHLC